MSEGEDSPDLDTAGPPRKQTASSTASASSPLEQTPFTKVIDPDGETRATLARWLILLLGFTIGGALFFIGFGRLDGAVLVQSILPSLIALVGTALGFYFGTQSQQNAQQNAQNPQRSPVYPNVPSPNPPPGSPPSGASTQRTE